MSADHDYLRSARGLMAGMAIGLLLYAAGLAIVAMWIWWLP